jgi:hypothetical protein
MAQREVEPALETWLAADRAEGIVLTRAPLMRMSAIHLPDGDVQMIWFHLCSSADGACPVFTEVTATETAQWRRAATPATYRP